MFTRSCWWQEIWWVPQVAVAACRSKRGVFTQRQRWVLLYSSSESMSNIWSTRMCLFSSHSRPILLYAVQCVCLSNSNLNSISRGWRVLSSSDAVVESGNGYESDSSPYFSGLGLGPSWPGLSGLCYITVVFSMIETVWSKWWQLSNVSVKSQFWVGHCREKPANALDTLVLWEQECLQRLSENVWIGQWVMSAVSLTFTISHWNWYSLPYLTLPLGWAGCYTCPVLRPYQFGPMRNPDVTKGHSDRLWSRQITSHLGLVTCSMVVPIMRSALS